VCSLSEQKYEKTIAFFTIIGYDLSLMSKLTPMSNLSEIEKAGESRPQAAAV
jgi:hypothetical protein